MTLAPIKLLCPQDVNHLCSAFVLLHEEGVDDLHCVKSELRHHQKAHGEPTGKQKDGGSGVRSERVGPSSNVSGNAGA